MRGKKLAFIYTDRKPESYYYQLHNGLFESFEFLTRNFEVMVFAYAGDLNVMRRKDYDIAFRNDHKTMDYYVNTYFEPTHVFFVGSDFDYEKIKLPKKTPKYLIHKGKNHDPKWYDYFDNVIVETEEEKVHYKNSVVASAVNTRMYFPQITEKYFTFCFPQELSQSKLEFFSKVRVYGSISQTLNSTVKLPLEATQTLSTVFNQSKGVAFIDDTNDSYELALSALSCNVPVIASLDSKASKIPAVVKSVATTPDFTLSMLETLNLENKHNFRDEYIMPNYTPKQYAKMLMDLIV
jgi:hypothetical protein